MMEDIKIERDEASEEYAGIKIEGCSAGTNEDDMFTVIGEAISKSGKPFKNYVEIHATVYDAQARIVGRGYTNFASFGLRQSFDIDIELMGTNPVPAMVRVFPTKND